MSTAATDVSRRKAWLMAARPQTLPAGVAPVVVGSAFAVHADVFAPLPAIAALVGALLIQIGTNFANDYYDAVKGTDDPDRDGFTRVTAGGLIRPSLVKRAMIGTYGLAMLVGVYLVAVGGLPVVAVGLASIVAGILYTGGPKPYGYYGLGDVFVFCFFGLFAVTGTYYVQAVASLQTVAGRSAVGTFPTTIPPGTVPPMVVLASVPAACLATTILVVNNLRDMEDDAAAGKRTLAVILGYRWSRVEFVALVALGYLVPIVFALDPSYGLPALAPLLSLPLAAVVLRTVLTRTDGEPMNRALERTGMTLFAHSLLFAAGVAGPSLL